MPAARTGLAVEASADQVETIAADGTGVKLTVAVTNHGPAAATGVALTGAGTTCGRTLGTIAPGRTVVDPLHDDRRVHRPGTSRDRVPVPATAGGTTVASQPGRGPRT